MSLFSPVTWVPDFFLLREPANATTKRLRLERICALCVFLAVAGLSRWWLSLVTNHVPEPYLDEVFHIPQAQAFCEGRWDVWDPKLTTPPGLYLISVFLFRYLMRRACTVELLRMTNMIGLLFLLIVAYSCRLIIITPKRAASTKTNTNPDSSAAKGVNWHALHTAVNITLFPPLFFFSGLYYTDVLSTCLVLLTYRHFLHTQDTRPKIGLVQPPTCQVFKQGFKRGVGLYSLGIFALLMRQTNIFWVAVFLAGQDIVSAFHAHQPPTDIDTEPGVAHDAIVKACGRGAIRDPKLADVDSAYDLYFNVGFSIVVATLMHMRMVIIRVWPYIALLASFAAFVLWNSGVVLGDKSNHIATLHLPQLLYLFPFITFVSLPLLAQDAVGLLLTALPTPLVRHLPAVLRRLNPSHFDELTPGTLVFFTLLSVPVIYANTIIHPFTLADNRHYVFYIFRYSILRHWSVKYLLAPIYVLCAWLIIRCLAGPDLQEVSRSIRLQSERNRQIERNRDKANGGQGAGGQGRDERVKVRVQEYRPPTSILFIWFLSTALSLVTAPLVEPRYFLVPWVVWRLHVAQLPQLVIGGEKTKLGLWGRVKSAVYEGHDYRLWLETGWSLLVSAVTGYVFLFKAFEWAQEPGVMQRFLW